MGVKRISGKKILLASVLLVLAAIVLVESVSFNFDVSPSSVSEDISNLYNFTVENTNTTSAIIEVNITIPSGFNFTSFTNGSSTTIGIFSNSSNVLAWYDSALITPSSTQNFWFNATSEIPGKYNFTIQTLDDSGVLNLTNVSVTVNDATLPDINLVFPFNQNYNSIQTAINYTASDNVALSSCKYSLDNGAINNTITCGQNITGLSSDQGSNNWTVYATDSTGNENSSNVTFFVDSIFPTVNIVSPLNNSNNSNNNLDINFTRNDTNLQSCWYSNDTYTTNTTLASCGNITSVVWSDGNHNVTIWANDTLGNLNFNSISFNIDTIFPAIASFSFTGTYFNETDYIFSPANSDGLYDNISVDLSYS